MATLLEYGTVPVWGIGQNEDPALLLTSLDMTTSVVGEYVQKNNLGQTCGWLGYDQESTFNMSGALAAGSTAMAYTLGSAVALNNFADNNDFVTGLGAGTAKTDRTSICKEIKRTLSNTAAVQIDISGITYNFASTQGA